MAKAPELLHSQVVYVSKSRKLAWGGTVFLERLLSSMIGTLILNLY